MEPNSTLGEPIGVVHVTINGQKVPANVYKGMNNETLVSIEQCFPASSTAKKAQEPVQEQTATQEVGASVKKVNFQNVTNKPKLIVLDNRNRKQDGDTE